MRTFMFIVLIPALIALGHDCYLFYENQERGFMFAAIGFIWTHYHAESFKIFAQSMEPEIWAMVNTLMAQKAFFVGLAFAGFFYVILGLMKILGLGPFSKREKKMMGRMRGRGASSSGPMKYNRK